MATTDEHRVADSLAEVFVTYDEYCQSGPGGYIHNRVHKLLDEGYEYGSPFWIDDSCVMVDILDDGTLLPAASITKTSWSSLDEPSEDINWPTDHFHRLRNHGANLRTRIVICREPLSSSLLDLFGLEYSVDPKIIIQASDFSPRCDGQFKSCSKKRPQMIDLGYRRSGIILERECGSGAAQKHMLNIVVSEFTN